jgi:hypothetical protein
VSALGRAARQAFSWPSLFADGTPGFRINIEEAIRLNKAAIGSKTSGFTPEELSRCVAFQDSAGTLPVTAMEQPLGYIKDLSGNGNHFIQPSNTASRPIVSRRVNLLTATEDFTNAAWVWSGTPGTVTQNAGMAPDGTNTAIKLAIPAGGPRQNVGNRTDAKFRIWVKSAGDGKDVFRLSANSSIVTGNLTATNEWQEFEFSPTSLGVGGAWGPIIGYGVDSTSILVWHPDVRLSIDAPALPPYQRVTSATDYDESGFPAYAKFDGVDDWLESGVVDMTSTDEVTVLAGVTKLADPAGGVVLELGETSTNNGMFAIYAPVVSSSVLRSFGFVSRGTKLASAIPASNNIPAPAKRLLTGIGKISTDTSILRVNGVQAASSPVDQGPGNYGARKFYMGRRTGTSLPFNGRVYGVTLLGKLLTDSQLAAAEQAERNLGRLY